MGLAAQILQCQQTESLQRHLDISTCQRIVFMIWFDIIEYKQFQSVNIMPSRTVAAGDKTGEVTSVYEKSGIEFPRGDKL